MLSEREFAECGNRLAFPPAGLKYLRPAPMSGLSRKVGGGGSKCRRSQSERKNHENYTIIR